MQNRMFMNLQLFNGNPGGGAATIGNAGQFLRQFAGMAGLVTGMKANQLRANGLLRKDEWKLIDEVVVDIARGRLSAVADLQARGLVHNLGGLGVMISEYERQGDMNDAEVAMSVLSAPKRDAVDFDLAGVPVPITWKEFWVDIRRLEASRRMGSSIDTTQATVAARKVSEGLERLVIRGNALSVDGRRIYGYTTAPHRHTGVAKAPWNDIDSIYPTVLEMIKDAHSDHMYGPYVLYVSGDVWPYLLQIYADGSGDSALKRLKENIPGLEDIKPLDEMDPGEAVLVQMTRDVVDLAVGQDVVTLQDEARYGLLQQFLVMGVMVPRVKSDKSGQCGIVHYTGLVETPAAG